METGRSPSTGATSAEVVSRNLNTEIAGRRPVGGGTAGFHGNLPISMLEIVILRSGRFDPPSFGKPILQDCSDGCSEARNDSNSSSNSSILCERCIQLEASAVCVLKDLSFWFSCSVQHAPVFGEVGRWILEDRHAGWCQRGW